MINTRDTPSEYVTCRCETYVAERIHYFRTEMCATCGRPSIEELQRILAESTANQGAKHS